MLFDRSSVEPGALADVVPDRSGLFRSRGETDPLVVASPQSFPREGTLLPTAQGKDHLAHRGEVVAQRPDGQAGLFRMGQILVQVELGEIRTGRVRGIQLEVPAQNVVVLGRTVL